MVKLSGTAYRKMQKSLKEASEIMEFFDDVIEANEAIMAEEEKISKSAARKTTVAAQVPAEKEVNPEDVNKLLAQAEEKVNKRNVTVNTKKEEKTNFEREAELDEKIKQESMERRMYEEEAKRLEEARLAFEKERMEFFEMQRRQKLELQQLSLRDQEIENDLRRLAELRRRQDVLAQIVDVNLAEDKSELARREQYLNSLLYRPPQPTSTTYPVKPTPAAEAPKYGYMKYNTKDIVINSADEVLRQYQEHMAKRGAVINSKFVDLKPQPKPEPKIESKPEPTMQKPAESKAKEINTVIDLEAIKEELRREILKEIKGKETDPVAAKLFEPIEPEVSKAVPVEPEIEKEKEAVQETTKPEIVTEEINEEVKEINPELKALEDEGFDVQFEPEMLNGEEEESEASHEPETIEEVITPIDEFEPIEEVLTPIDEFEATEEEVVTPIDEFEPVEEINTPIDELTFDAPVDNADNNEENEKEAEAHLTPLDEFEIDEDLIIDPKKHVPFVDESLKEEIEEETVEEEEEYAPDPNNPYGLSKRNIKELEFIKTMSKKPVKENAVLKYITSGEEYFQEVIESMLAAKKYIAIEVSTLKEGRIWASVKEILKNKALEEVPVYLLFNSFGVPEKPLTSNMMSLDKGMFNVASFYEEEKKGGTGALSKVGQKIGSILFGSSGSSTGRKRKGVRTLENSVNLKNMVIVDGKVCYIGSVGFTDTAANIDASDNARYVKSGSMKIIGNAVSNYVEMFVKDYNAITGEKLEAHKMSFQDADVDAVAFNRTGGLMATASGDPKEINEIIEQIIFNSADYVCIAMPYYAITDGILSSLVVAAKTLVDVRVYISPYRNRSDFDGAVKKFDDKFGESGVKLYKYNYGELNCSIVLSDDECVLLGGMPYDTTVKSEKSEAYIIGINAIDSVKKDILEINDYSVVINEKKKLKN